MLETYFRFWFFFILCAHPNEISSKIKTVCRQLYMLYILCLNYLTFGHLCTFLCLCFFFPFCVAYPFQYCVNCRSDIYESCFTKIRYNIQKFIHRKKCEKLNCTQPAGTLILEQCIKVYVAEYVIGGSSTLKNV